MRGEKIKRQIPSRKMVYQKKSVETGASHIEKVEEKQDNSNQSVPAQEGIKFYRATLDEEYSTSRPHKVEKDRNVKWFNDCKSALQILEEGTRVTVSSADIESKYEEVKNLNDYYTKIDTAQGNVDAGNLEQAEAEYKEALEIDNMRVEAYEGISNLYISQERYDEAINSIEPVSKINLFQFKDLKEKCWLSKVNKMMADSDYNGLLQYFKNDRSLLHTNDLYFQDGNVVESIEDGAGIILSDYGVYAGEISNNQRSGNGKQFGTYSSDSTYSVTAGQWSNDKANGQCTYSYVDTADSSRTETVVGNVTENLFNGESASGWYWYYDTEESLQGHGIWSAY